MAQTMNEKRDGALMRRIAYEARTTKQQLNKISGRNGESKKETARLKAKLASEKPTKKVIKKEPKEKEVIVEDKLKKKFKKGISKNKKS